MSNFPYHDKHDMSPITLIIVDNSAGVAPSHPSFTLK